MSSTWDDLRRQARILENELDTKLALFGKVCPRSIDVSSPHCIVSGISGKSEISSTGNREDFTPSFHTMCSEIEDLLQELTQINDRMATFVPDTDNSTLNTIGTFDNSLRNPSIGPNVMAAGHLSQLHTAKRHREILRDYAQEFRQTKAKLVASRERDDLLGSIYRDLNNRTNFPITNTEHTQISTSNFTDTTNNQRPSTQSSTISNSTRLLLNEQEKYHHSNRLLDEHLAAASTIRAALRAQRFALRTASTGLLNLSSYFPQVKKLITKIDWRHKQDSIVLGLVIGCCVVFLLIYRFG